MIVASCVMPPLMNSGSLNDNKSNGVFNLSEVFPNFYLPLRRVLLYSQAHCQIVSFFYCGTLSEELL